MICLCGRYSVACFGYAATITKLSLRGMSPECNKRHVRHTPQDAGFEACVIAFVFVRLKLKRKSLVMSSFYEKEV